MNTVIGIDEAGRGPVLGPMVIAAVKWNDEVERYTSDANVKVDDSKNLSESARLKSADFLRNNVEYRICSVPAWVLSQPKVTIPQVEARIISSLLETLNGQEILSDALGSGNKAHQWIKNSWPAREFSFESGADERYPSVSAASILAKVTRDQAIETLKDHWGELGSGYPSDPKTKEWIQSWASKEKSWPPFVRTSWSTIRNI
jgi:ribonuclease HII